MDEKNHAAAGVDPLPENSSVAAAAARVEEQEEESGWTDYLEDYYFSSENERESSFLCSSIGSCSWDISESDANNNRNFNVLSAFSSVGEVILDVPKKLTFKKTRTQKIFEDDSLEDTATSPIHSPKVSS